LIWVGGKAYKLVHEHKDGWKPEMFKERYSEVLDRYDYIVGDWGYNQLRLKGFFREGNSKATKETVITSLQEYLQEYCNFGCAYFVLERIPTKNEDPAGTSLDDSLGTAEGESAAARAPEAGDDVMSGRGSEINYSDRKPYSWREDQAPVKYANRNADRNADRSVDRGADAAEKAAVSGKAADEGGAGTEQPGKGRAAHADGRQEKRPFRHETGADPAGAGEGRQFAGSGRKYNKRPRNGGSQNKGRGGSRHPHAGRSDGREQRAQQRHHHKPPQREQ